MTNTEGNDNSISAAEFFAKIGVEDPQAFAASQEEVDAMLAADAAELKAAMLAPKPADLSLDPGYVTTHAPMDGHFDHPSQAFRYLNWLWTKTKGKVAMVNMSHYSTQRREGIADLVRNGLVSERVYTGGGNDGMHTLKITELGVDRLHAAWEVAALAVIA